MSKYILIGLRNLNKNTLGIEFVSEKMFNEMCKSKKFTDKNKTNSMYFGGQWLIEPTQQQKDDVLKIMKTPPNEEGGDGYGASIILKHQGLILSH